MTNPAMAMFAALFLAVAAAGGAIRSVDDILFSDDYVLRTWEVTEGLGDNHISGIAQGADGYLWITNFSGLLRFDGDRFVRMDKKSMPGLPSPWVAPVFTARDQTLWLGLERGGVALWRGNHVETIVPIHPRPTSEVWPWSFAEEASGAMWFGMATEARATRVSSGKMVTYTSADGIPAGTETTVRVATDGKVWVSTAGGCAWFDGHRFRPVEPDLGGDYRLQLAPSRAGGMWTIRKGMLLRYGSSGERLETITPPWLQDVGQVNALHEDRTGTLWIGTRDYGLLRFRDGEFTRVHTSLGDISCLTEDREGNLWVGTWGGGLNRLSARHFFLRQTQSGLPHDVAGSLCEDAEGKLWIVSRDNRDRIPARATEPGGRTFSPVTGWPLQQGASVVCADPKGAVWLGTPDGLIQWMNGALRRTSFLEPVAALFLDREGNLWIATVEGGVFRYRDGHFEAVGDIAKGWAMAEDASGYLWVGTRQGSLFRWEDGRFQPIALPGAGAEESVRFIIPDGKDTVWIGTLLGGIYRWKNGRVLRVSDASGVSLAEVRSMLIERAEPSDARSPGRSSPQDTFWIGTATGLLRVSRGDLEGFLDGRLASLRLLRCGSNEGLPNAEFAEGVRNTAVQTKDGHLWFATNRGLLEIQPGAVPERPAAARVMIEEASAGSLTFRAGIRAGISDQWVFPPTPGAIRIRYTLPELGIPEQVRFRYRLGDGSGAGQWIDAGSQREATILQPEPGKHRFEVTAALGDGLWLAPPAVVDFTVRAAWWQTAVFRWGIALAAIGAIALGVREIVTRRMQARIRRLEQEHAIERERGRIARDMHDELGANLTHIATTTRLAALDPTDATAGHLREIAAIARQTVDSLDEIVWTVNPRKDTLAGTVEYIGKHAVRFLAAAGIAVEIDLPDAPPARPISAEMRHHLFLAVKEALNNVAKHSGAANARLSIRIASESLEVVVADDGRGFAAGTADGFSNGLVNMRDRLAGIGGHCRIESSPGAGCRVTFELPLSENPRRTDSA